MAKTAAVVGNKAAQTVKRVGGNKRSNKRDIESRKVLLLKRVPPNNTDINNKGNAYASATQTTPHSLSTPFKADVIKSAEAALSLSSSDLDFVKYRLVSKGKWTEQRADEAIHEYLRFLVLLSTGKQGESMAPSLEVDEVWHAHILHTAMYAKHCQQVAGRFIHHAPSKPTESKETSYAAYLVTLRRYEEVFHEEAPVSVWPTPLLGAAECDECHSIRCNAQCPSCNAQCGDDSIALH